MERGFSMSKYPKLKDFEGFCIDPENQILHFACCDCGLVHRIGMAIVGSSLEIAFQRHNRATAQLRRHKFGNLQNAEKSYRIIK